MGSKTALKKRKRERAQAEVLSLSGSEICGVMLSVVCLSVFDRLLGAYCRVRGFAHEFDINAREIRKYMS